MNKYYNSGNTLKQSKLRNLINYKSRDWEIWFNLKDNLLKNANPVIKKDRNIDNSFTLKLLFDRNYLDRTSHINYQIPTLHHNKTADLYHYDIYRTKIPDNPDYVHRIIDIPEYNDKGGLINKSKKLELVTVHSKVSFN